MKRDKIIVQTSIIGIIFNIALVLFKATIGLIINSIAVVLDAVNNLTDALSSIITIIGIKLSGKAPDKEHPYGHGRIEYIASLFISGIILFAGITAGKESFLKIINPGETKYSEISLVIIVVAVISKFIYGKKVKRIGKRISSQSLIASGQDAFMDSVLSFSTLVSGILNYIWDINIEGYLGVFISIIIIKSAYNILKETANLMIGQRPSKELTRDLIKKITSFEGVQGAYDLSLHNYGPLKIIASVHIQVRNDMTAEEIHILTREIEYAIYEEFGIALTIGIYAANDKGEFGEIKSELERIVKQYSNVLQIHGFYVDKLKSNVYFDLVLDFNEKNKEKIKNEIIDKLKTKYDNYNYNVIMDSDVSD